MGNVAVRLISLIMLLQSRPTWKASELAEELGVSERTVHRYMGMLEALGIPLYSERGPYGGFALVRGYKLPPLVFTAEEAPCFIWARTWSARCGFTIPRDFSARDYITRTLSFEQNHTVVVHIAAEVAPHIRERYGHWMHVTEHPDGSVTAQFGASTLEWATGWVLSYGCAVRVLEPPELIVRVQAEAEAVFRQYG